MKFITSSPYQTKMLAKAFASALPAGSVILAYGELGSGKTAFAKGIALALHVSDVVNSPTFNIIKFYPGKPLDFYHIDAYRLEGRNDDIGFTDFIGKEENITYIEWPDVLNDYYKNVKHLYKVVIDYIDLNKRQIEIVEVKQ